MRKAIMADPAETPISIRYVTGRFPADGDLILRCAQTDSAFRSLCEDYALALEVVRRLVGVERQKVESRIAEYRALVADLESDIQCMLVKCRRAF